MKTHNSIHQTAEHYIAPTANIIVFSVEQGFSISGETNYPGGDVEDL